MRDARIQCSVCHGPIEETRLRGKCDECGHPFHLDLRAGLDLSSCGAAYVGAACGMNVYCDPCGVRIGAGLVRVG